MIFPPQLQIGDKIAIISPAGSVEGAGLEPTLQLLVSHGYKPVLGANALKKYNFGYSYAGTEQERAKDVVWAFQDPEIAAVWATRGGYGCQQLLRHLPVGIFQEHPKWYIGYSDNTVLQSTLCNNGVASIHGQTIKTADGGVSKESYNKILEILKGKLPAYKIENTEFNTKGNARGALVGGNLSLIYALLGTNDGFNFKDKILFMEEVGEQYYALDRMLVSLQLAGVFDDIAGLIVGGMTNMGDKNSNKNYGSAFDTFASELIAERLKSYPFPKIFNFPNGHIYDNQPLIIGAQVAIAVGNQAEIAHTHGSA